MARGGRDARPMTTARHAVHSSGPPMPKMPASELKAMLAAEYADALAALTGSSKLSAERADAMDYYLRDMARDMPVPEGRSRAVSTDVADTIEGLMPSLIEIFCGSDLEPMA